MGILLQDSHEGSAVGQTFLQKFYAGKINNARELMRDG